MPFEEELTRGWLLRDAKATTLTFELKSIASLEADDEEPEESKMATVRSEILSKAGSVVNGDREKSYGSPEENFRRIGAMWNAYLGRALNRRLSPSDVAAMMSLVKLSRIASGKYSEDNWIDLAGYAACGGELASFEHEDHEDGDG